jgi:uncharacterized protein (TIGR03437 family)
MRPAICLLLLSSHILAQNTTQAPAVIASAGYSAPADFMQAAPGQILSLFVYGLDHRLADPVMASGVPLPLSLAGFSVQFQQGSTTLAVPLLGISQAPCNYPYAGPNLCESLTTISLQAPFEIVPDCRLCGRPTLPAFFTVFDGGVAQAVITTTLPPDNIHITDACDSTAQLGAGVACGKIVTHGDGTRVDANHPAAAGEQLVMYAFGLGQTDPLVKSGAATPNPPPELPPSQFSLNFTLAPNAAPGLPADMEANPAFNPPRPVYVGLVSGFVGLYQVNFTVPAAPAETPYTGCNGAVLSDLTVTVYTANSLDGAGICVQP